MPSDSLKQDLVLANRILANEEVVDAYGHITARPPDADKMFVSTYQSPALVTEEDIIEMSLDGEILTEGVEGVYSEHVIHRAIYRNRDEIHGVAHCHAPELIPFIATDVELKPVSNQGRVFYQGLPIFDEYDYDERGRLIVTEEEGQRMADVLGDRPAQLLGDGHGANIVGRSVREAVTRTMRLVREAKIVTHALDLGDPEYLDPLTDDVNPTARGVDRQWDYFVNRLPEESRI